MSGVFTKFADIWAGDFEFTQRRGERPTPICLVLRELHTDRTVRLWEDELRNAARPPFHVGPESLFVGFYVSAEMGCFLELGWPTPIRILDLYAEFRCLTNGREVPCGNGLLGALTYYGLDALAVAEKDSLRQLAMRGGPFTPAERAALLDYCESDVRAVEELLAHMDPVIDLPRALLRGRFMAAAARIERAGVPVDSQTLACLQQNWSRIKERLIERVDADFGVFIRIEQRRPPPDVPTAGGDTNSDADVGQAWSFSSALFEQWLARNGIPWPRLASGKLDLEDETFRQMARRCPAVAPLRELRYTLSKLRLNDLAAGADGRTRCLLSAFQASTSRNQPSSSQFIFGPSVWLRGLAQPELGKALAYVDWSAQEIGIAAALSGDNAMQAAYIADPYLWLAKAGKYAPSDATKKTHPEIREVFKIVYLAANYGMGERSLSQWIGRPPAYARELLRLHREQFPTFWRWNDGVLSYAMLHGHLWTAFGWSLNVGQATKPTSLRNFPMQSNGAEMLRLACCLGTERGVTICAPVHDAVLIEAPIEEIDTAITTMQQAMTEASELVLDGFRLRTSVDQIVRYPDHFMDERRGRRMWDIVMSILAELQSA